MIFSRQLLFVLTLFAAITSVNAQSPGKQIVIVTGVRFSYPLVQKWIDDYTNLNPGIQVVIEARGSGDPGNFDILVEAYEHDSEQRKGRDYAYVARYAVVPVANSKSAFAKTYAASGLSTQLIRQLFFDDMFADADKAQKIEVPYTAYTRLQKAGAPLVFASAYGFQQKDIKGKAIAGSDEHLLKAILRDSTAVSYLPLTLAIDPETRKSKPGLTILPVDLNDNGKISNDEKLASDPDRLISVIEATNPKELRGLAIGYLHLSVRSDGASEEAADFIRYVIDHGSESLHPSGFVLPEESKVDKSKFKPLATNRN